MSEEVIAVLKTKRTALRTAITKYCKKIESELTQTEICVEELEETLALLNDKAETLKHTDASLEQYFKPSESEKEFENVEEYREKITLWKLRAEKRLFLKASALPTHNTESPIQQIPKETANVRLPKLSIPNFYGDSSQWLTFWSSFESMIHNNELLNKIDKFNYLKTYLSGTAASIAEGFSLTAENYDSVVELLKDRFGRKDTLINAHMSNLLNISPLKYSNDLKAFRNLFDRCQTQIRSLEALGVVSDTYGALLCPLLLKLLPQELVLEFNKTEGANDYKVNDLMNFLMKELNSRERTRTAIAQQKREDSSKQSSFPPPLAPRRNFFPPKSDLSAAGKNKHMAQKSGVATATDLFTQSEWNREHKVICVFCNNSHESKNCNVAQNLSLDEKKDILKKKGVCFRCLRNKHIARMCAAKITCSICGNRHVSVMCSLAKNKNVNASGEKRGDKGDSGMESTVLTNQSENMEVYLQTLVVCIYGKNDKKNFIRCILDTGSQNSYLSKYAAKMLELKSLREEIVTHGLFGGLEVSEKHNRYRVRIGSLDDINTCEVDVLDEEKICSIVPKVKNKQCIGELKNRGIYVSDIFAKEEFRLFQENPQEIHLLLGADTVGSLFTGEIQRLPWGGLVALNTKLGWTLMGKMIADNANAENSLSALSLSLHVADSKLADLWRLDTLGILDQEENKNKSLLEAETKKYFSDTLKRNEDGRYEVSLPWILDQSVLPSNRELAEKCLRKTEKKLISSHQREDYQKVFNYWESNDIIERVTDEKEYATHYLPHRPIIKETSETTKIRPVFNASARTKNSPSLNDCLAKGPNLIEILPSILNRFRKYRVGISSDIEKAFLQINIRDKDRDFLRFLWFDDDNNLKIYRHKRVVFGLTSSPFLLAATLDHHLNQVPANLFKTSELLRSSFYVDNSLISLDSVEEAKHFIEESKLILSSGHFNLRCWKSNLPNAIIDEIETETDNVHLLGLIWNTEADTLALKIDHTQIDYKLITKRKALSLTQRIFDPVGFTVPVILIAKIILQEAWQLKLKWDDELPASLANQFKSWCSQLFILSQLRIPRWLNVTYDEENKVTLHTFCDASKRAYATCVFLRIENTSGVKVQLVNCRSRVAPLKPMTIPRLELLACLIGARLASTVTSDLKFPSTNAVFWCDSTTSLGWIKRESQWGTFVHNRVQEIRSLTNPSDWRHVPGNLNPADLPSRGCSADQLQKSRWWEGPSWLYLPETEWPQTDEQPDEELLHQEKRKTVLTLQKKENNSNWYYRYFSSFRKTVRLIAWIFRFFHNTKARISDRNTSSDLSVMEIEQAEKLLYRLIQRDSFSGKDDKSIRSLRPVEDQDGILRAKTNIVYRQDTEDFRYPMILPSNHPVVHLLIFETHVEKQHAGVAILMANLREKFWILKTRKTIRNVINKCVKCQRFNVQKSEVEPGIPPEDRVRDASIFEVVGVDLAGPLYLKGNRKSWIVLFTCAVYRAIHLELVTSLSTEAFVQSLRRFVARRGKPFTIYSDNGSNFVGTDRALCSIDWEAVLSIATTHKIRWKFNPPFAAWWGGWWERLIRMLKQLLKRVLGRASLDYEELLTILCDCEQVINSRPISYVSEDVSDPTPLTPEMFLHDLPTAGIPDIDAVDGKELSKRAKYRQRIRDVLRRRFRNEYFGQLRQPVCNKQPHRQLCVGDVVLLEDAKRNRIHWPLAKVIDIFPGKDNIVRVAKVKTQSGIFLRPVQKIYQLEIPTRENDTLHKPVDLNTATSEDENDIPETPVIVRDAKHDKINQPIIPIDRSPVMTRAGRLVRPPKKLTLTALRPLETSGLKVGGCCEWHQSI